MKNKLKVFLYIIIFLNFLNLSAYENKIIAKINNSVITSFDLKNKILTTLMLANEEINQNNINKTKPLVFQSLIDLKIKEDETKKFKVEVSKVELDKSLETYVSSDTDNFEEKFKLYNVNFELFKKDLKTEIAWRKLIYALFNKKIQVNDTEIDLELQKILQANKTNNKEFRLSEIVVNFNNQSEKDQKIKELSDQIKKIGFDKTLLKYSESINKNNLGDLGWMSSKSLSKNILAALKKSNIGDVSDPIIISNTVLFLKIKDIRNIELNEKNIEDLKTRIVNAKKNQMFNLYSNSHLSKLKNLSSIEYQ
jgi:peptidyl-prolyl cis-trans isomerase SurA